MIFTQYRTSLLDPVLKFTIYVYGFQFKAKSQGNYLEFASQGNLLPIKDEPTKIEVNYVFIGYK